MGRAFRNKSEWDQIKAKAKWAEEGEKKYFLNLERRNTNSTYIKKIINNDQEEITDINNIIKEEVKFYENLYTSKLNAETSETEKQFLDHEKIPKLVEIDKNLCDQSLSIEECSLALKQLANNKSPGSDGYTTNFYKKIWKDIKELVYDIYIYSKLWYTNTESNTRYINPATKAR